MKTIKAAVIGTGFMGGTHAEALRRVEGVEIVAVASNSQERAQDLAGRYGIPNTFDDWRHLLDFDVDVIHNCTPNDLHFEINKAFLENGKHLVSEKPLTIHSHESAELVRLAEEQGVVAAVCFTYRGYPLVRQARALVAQGEVGDIHNVHGHYIQDWLLFDTDYNWRLESGVSGPSRAIADIGSHWCDLVQYVTGLKIEAVFADLFRVYETRKKPAEVVMAFQKSTGPSQEVPIDTEDGGNILIRFEGGARGVVTVSQVSAGRKNRQWFEIDGTKKALSWNQEEPNNLWIGHRDRPNEVLIKDPGLLDASAAAFAHYPGGHPEGYPDGFKNVFSSVYRWVREGRMPSAEEADFPTFLDGHREVQMVEAVLKSHAEETWVNIEG